MRLQYTNGKLYSVESLTAAHAHAQDPDKTTHSCALSTHVPRLQTHTYKHTHTHSHKRTCDGVDGVKGLAPPLDPRSLPGLCRCAGLERGGLPTLCVPCVVMSAPPRDRKGDQNSGVPAVRTCVRHIAVL